MRTSAVAWELGNISGDLGLGVVAGVVAGIVLAVWETGRRWWRRRRVRALDRRVQHHALAEAPEAERVRVTVKGKVLNVVYVGVTPGDSVVGKIAMSEDLTGRGEGYYDHVKGKRQLWGFWDIQVRNRRTILVHTTYAQLRGSQKRHVRIRVGTD